MSGDRSIEWTIANTINETAHGDPDALASRILAALSKAGYRIVPNKSLIALLEDSVREGSSQPFFELKWDKRPQDIYGDGRDMKFVTSEHGGAEPTTCLKRSKPSMHKVDRRFTSR